MSSVEMGAAARTQRNIPPPQDVAAFDKGVKTASRTQQEAAKLPTDVVAAKAEAKAKAETVPTGAELGEAVESINQFVNAQMRTLNFSVDENSGKPVVKVVDFDTKDVIRQIPGEEVLKMASAIKRLQEDLGSATGLLINSKV